MHIVFKFEYIHDNGLFSRLLKRIETFSETPVSLIREGNFYRIEASGDQPTLEALAHTVSSLTPHSLFLNRYAVESLDKEDDEALEVHTFDLEEQHLKTPCCPECQTKVSLTLNPFESCEVCGFSDVSLRLEDLTEATGIKAHTPEEFFHQLSNKLLTDGVGTLPTYNGERTFRLVENHGNVKGGFVYCNPDEISSQFLITQRELEALMLIEKPTVRLKPKSKFRVEHGLNDPFYPIFFPDDKITLALCTVMRDSGVKLLHCDQVPTLRVASSLEEHLIVTPGRDILPWKYPMSLKTASFCSFGGVEAYGDQDGLVVDTKVKPNHRSYIHYVSDQAQTTAKNTIRFEPGHGALRSVILEEGLEGKALCGIYLSREHPSHIFSFSKKIGYTPLVVFNDQGITQPSEMISAIEAMDEGGARLVQNFKKGFPELYEKLEQQHFTQHADMSDITKIWALAAAFIGLYEGDDLLESAEVLEATAINFSGKSGPRIDYKVKNSEEGYRLDIRLAIRSAMSFKLAGLDDYLLSFGFIDSLADFIAEQAENADANIGIEGVVLSGSIFENRQLLMRTYNAISMNYPLYRNRCLSIDGANVAVGAITLGSEV